MRCSRLELVPALLAGVLVDRHRAPSERVGYRNQPGSASASKRRSRRPHRRDATRFGAHRRGSSATARCAGGVGERAMQAALARRFGRRARPAARRRAADASRPRATWIQNESSARGSSPWPRQVATFSAPALRCRSRRACRAAARCVLDASRAARPRRGCAASFISRMSSASSRGAAVGGVEHLLALDLGLDDHHLRLLHRGLLEVLAQRCCAVISVSWSSVSFAESSSTRCSSARIFSRELVALAQRRLVVLRTTMRRKVSTSLGS